jgi:hypothetical protein
MGTQENISTASRRAASATAPRAARGRAFPGPLAPRDAWSSAFRHVPLPHSSVAHLAKDRRSVRRRPDARVPETPPSVRWTRAGARVDYKGPVALALTRRSSPPLR